jgi:homocysteine S-methyltransferase
MVAMDRLPGLLVRASVVLTEGSVVERLRRNPQCTLDEHVAHAAFPTSPGTARILAGIYREYLDIAEQSGLPMLCFSPTWRANPERIRAARLSGDVNAAGVAFVKEIIAGRKDVLVGGLMGCYGDAYIPGQALSATDAARFHAFQANALARGGCDFLCAATMPAAGEALGIASAMARTGLPYLVSFIITRDGTLLDGTPMVEVIACTDRTISPAPLGYMANCVHPSIMAGALARCGAASRSRILGLQANTSPKSPAELDGIPQLETEDPEPFAGAMEELHRRFGLKILGGCCGTDARHIRSLAARFAP